MVEGATPQFKLLQDGKLNDLTGDIPAWFNNQLYIVSSLKDAIVLLAEFRLDRAYLNPFNPATTLHFVLPIDSEVTLSIYNLQGREYLRLW